jgi:hypothetical protein
MATIDHGEPRLVDDQTESAARETLVNREQAAATAARLTRTMEMIR